MIDHVSLAVSNYAQSKDFYLNILKTLNYQQIMEYGEGCGMGDGRVQLWIQKQDIGKPIHLAFCAKNRTTVDTFYNTAIKAGAKDNGKPGLRTAYAQNYYAAFILDPDGHNIEVICREEA